MDTLINDLRERLGARIINDKFETGQVTIEVNAADLTEVCLILRDDEALAFNQLSDLCGVDYLSYGKADWETQDTTRTGFSRGASQAVVAPWAAGAWT